MTSDVTAAGLNFNHAANNWQISGTSNTLTVNGPVSVGAGSVSFNTAVAGTGLELTSSGGFVFFQNSANTFTGNVSMTTATLRLVSATALNTAVNLSFSGSLTLQLDAGGTVANALSIAGNLTLPGSNIAYTLSGNTVLGASAGYNVTTNAGNGAAVTGILSGGGFIKSGTGLMQMGGAAINTYSGPVDVQAGKLLINRTGATNNAILGDLTISGGTLILHGSNQIQDSSTVSMTSGTFQLASGATTPGTAQRETVNALAFNGGTFTGGGGLTLSSNGSATQTNAELRIDTGGTLSGGGSGLNIATTRLLSGGTISPGSNAELNIGTLGISSTNGVEWNGGGTMEFNLGPGGTSDLLAITNALTKGSAGAFTFDFLGFNATSPATYTLLTFGSQTGFVVGDFAATNITFDPGYTGNFVLNSGSLQYATIPEPATWSLLAVSLAALVGFRRGRAA